MTRVQLLLADPEDQPDRCRNIFVLLGRGYAWRCQHPIVDHGRACSSYESGRVEVPECA